MKKVSLIVIVLIVIVGIGVAWFVLQDNDSASTSSTETSTPVVTDTPVPETQETAHGVVITYDGENFSPATLTVKAGTVVTVKNDGSDTLDFASDDHPTHRINSDLNVGNIAPGQSANFTAQAGTWGFHDHLNASATGTLTVE